ncbi:protein BTG3-like [Portunus trituberculatus]|uniref:Protein BTG3 n=1 Tax=Portunus trituberculatus TaxID=210409 RepID=A0A5B7DID7_PORTR|nr:protein BTG3-like [Portunus trituberculatus]XP_045139309.1 protein BTG3-like [Portunus trituberculatus]MPC20875.1 Protein BTG3 [Portunus trituberculatus]
MKEEISAAVLFLSKLVSGNANLSEEMVAKFERRLGELLQERFSNHWHPERPWQGQGYRCLRVNEVTRKEPTIEQAAQDCGLKYKDLNLPVELTIWVDPEEVCCRFGEQKGSCCTVATFRDGNKENYIESFDFSQIKRPNSTPSVLSKDSEILKERKINVNNVPSHPNSSSPPSSTQSTPTKKPFLPTYGVYNGRNQNSPTRGNTAGNVHDRRTFGTYRNHYSSGPLNHQNIPHQNGSFSPPFYKTQSWVNLSQTPPPPPPPSQAHLPLLSSAGFIYTPTAPPHYSHSQMPPQFTRSPATLAPQKFKWNTSTYPRSDRHQWFGHRALARV